MSELASKPAFPRARGWAYDESGQRVYAEEQDGITIRQHYAGLALQGLLADSQDVAPEDWPKGAMSCTQATAMLAVQHADELIKALEEKPAS